MDGFDSRILLVGHVNLLFYDLLMIQIPHDVMTNNSQNKRLYSCIVEASAELS
jgi:hypothetical protein